MSPRVIAADWSGAARGEARHLWLASVDPTTHQLLSLENASRQQAADRLIAAGDRDPDLLVGLDFGFSLPAWFLRARRIASAAELWADVTRLESWLAACEPPFWGRPGCRRPSGPPEQHWRRTELAVTPRPKSVFQIGGAGAVGTASLRGMPVLARLRAAGFAVWPFDEPRPPVVAEVWPRLFAPTVVKSRRPARAAWLAMLPGLSAPLRERAEASADAFDAVVAAIGLSGTSPPSGVPDPIAQLEGWIWGVPFG